jgi:hypothetical protein
MPTSDRFAREGASMKLIFYSTPRGGAKLRPASPLRRWMDETDEAFAYRCLPLNIANAHGWELLCQASFTARWNGGGDLGAIDIRCAAQPSFRPTSVFGHGVLTFHIHGVFRTEPGWNLFVGGSPNEPKDGLYPLSGVIETDWAPYSFTMNWRFTRPDHWISFEEGEPFCFLYPVQRRLLETVEPEIRDMGSDAELQADFEQWGRERGEFSDKLTQRDTPERLARWQKRYYRGLDMRDKQGIRDHQAKLRLPAFADHRKADVEPAARPPSRPDFFQKVVPLSRTKHADLGLRDPNYSFAATANIIPLVAAEFEEAAKFYPLAFSSGNPPRAVCVVSGMAGVNLFVDEAGNWRGGYYVPAALRRFPFITIYSKETPDSLTLGIEEGSPLLDRAAPDKLFEKGEMTKLCKEKLAFAAKLGVAFEKTEEFANALPQDLLMPSRNLAPGRLAVRTTIRDLRVIDPEKLKALPAETLEAWRKNGWLAALEAHVASAQNWIRLLALEDQMPAAATPSK